MFTWSPKYSVGFEEIDFQHQKFIKLADTAILLIGSSNNKTDVKSKIDDFIKYAKWHFGTEQKYMDIINFDVCDEHLTQHYNIILKLDDLTNDLEKFDADFALELIVFVKKWFIDHILTLDKELYSCLLTEKQEHIIIKDNNI